MDMLVPFLVGMDWVQEAGAVLDFKDGHCFLPLMNGVVLNLPQTKRLTTCWMLSNTSQVSMLQYMSGWKSLKKNKIINDHPLEFFPVRFSDVSF